MCSNQNRQSYKHMRDKIWHSWDTIKSFIERFQWIHLMQEGDSLRFKSSLLRSA